MGWRERREIKAMQERWIARSGLVYAGIVREEIGKDKFRLWAGKRVRFEMKLEEGRGGIVARKYFEELKRRVSERREISD